jgi:hypothetical protein
LAKSIPNSHSGPGRFRRSYIWYCVSSVIGFASSLVTLSLKGSSADCVTRLLYITCGPAVLLTWLPLSVHLSTP